jgi:predicted O-methyltransferase YrrM
MDEKLEEYWNKSLKFKIQQKKNEWLDFSKHLLEITPIKQALEIGCYDGGTTIFLSHLCENLITIDQPNPPRFDEYKYNIGDSEIYGSKLLNTFTNFNYISGNSHSEETLNRVIKTLDGKKLDLLFIDGDHSYEGVKQDYKMYSQLVREGGIIAFHDVHESSFHESHNCYVHNFWKEIKDEFEDSKTLYCNQGQNSVWGGIGILIKK